MTIAVDQPPPPHVKRWTKREYNELVERGAFKGQRLYLFRGELIEMSPQYHPHAFAVTRLNKALFLAFGVDGGYEIRIQLPFETPGESMPEPDALVCTVEQNLRRPHPNQAVLAIEVADSSLATDREKALDYAAAQIPEYWIVDVNRRVVEVYRNPVADPTAILGFRYGQPTVYGSDASMEPLAKPDVKIQIAQLFPTAS
jgi:Uma2 family endonuclease